MVSEPAAAQKPYRNSEFDLTSIMATAYDFTLFVLTINRRKVLGINLPPLTRRDGWAATFENIFDLVKEPRGDTPEHLPDAPQPTLSPEVEAMQAPNDLQTDIMTVLSHLNGIPFPHHIKAQKDVSHWVGVHFNNHKKRTSHWKKSKLVDATNYKVVCQPLASSDWIDRSWTVNHVSGISFMTVSTRKLVGQTESSTTDKHNHTIITTTASIPYCLDAGNAAEKTVVGVSVCYPSPSPLHNRDTSQHWVWHPDATFRPSANPNLCLTNHLHVGRLEVTLERCEDKVNQHWAYHGRAPGDGGNGAIYFGDATNGLGVIGNE